MKITAIIPASGRGKRMQSEVAKQYMELCGKPLLYYAVKAFEDSPVDEIILVVSPGEETYVKEHIVEAFGFQKVTAVVAGGRERYHSVYNGVLAAEGSDYVLIHDGARPMLTGELIKRLTDRVMECGACVAAVPVKDTIKEADAAGNVLGTPDRSRLFAVQTPQAFSYDLILQAYKKLFEGEAEAAFVTDDASVVELLTEHPVKLVMGDYSNLKITTPEDLLTAQILLDERGVHGSC